MNIRSLLATFTLACALVLPAQAQSESTPAATPPPEQLSAPLQGLKEIVSSISAKIKAGANDASAFTDEAKAFDRLLTKYKDDKSEDIVRITYMKGIFYLQVMEDPDKARDVFTKLKADYPDSQGAAAADRAIAEIDRMQAATKAKAALIGEAAPELHFKWSSKSGLKKLSDLKGQVVVLDFWATWCGPCIGSFPQVREHVEHFKGLPVTFLGVTSIQGQVSNLEAKPINTKGDPQKEIGLIPAFMKKHDMTWDVAVSDESVFNPDYGIKGIPFVAIVAPDGTVRYAGIHPGDPEGDIDGKVTGLLKEFNLPTPK